MDAQWGLADILVRKLLGKRAARRTASPLKKLYQVAKCDKKLIIPDELGAVRSLREQREQYVYCLENGGATSLG